MPALGEYVNVYNTALAALESKGFQVWHNKRADMFCAERNGWDFMAENPISLLGLVAIYEATKPSLCVEYWWRAVGSHNYNSLPSEPRPYISVMTK